MNNESREIEKWPWPIWMYYSSTYFKGLKKILTVSVGVGLNKLPSKHKSDSFTH
jgi:hypothetical protein